MFFIVLLIVVQSEVLAQQNTLITAGTINFTFVDKDVNGSINGFSSNSKIDLEKPENSYFEGYVTTETIKTGNFLRDWSLKGQSYFDVDQFPKITFKSTKVTTSEKAIIVDGKLTIKDITKTIAIQFTKEGNILRGSTNLFSSDFDITILKKGRESNKVLVKFELELK